MGVQVNLGCGPFPAPSPWVNIDVREQDTVSPECVERVILVADVLDRLPFDDHTVSRVYAGHVLEHIPYAQLDAALDEIRRVLTPDGTLMVVGPDIHRARELHPDSDDLHRSITGEDANQDTPHQGDLHAWVCDETLTLQALRAAGYDAHPVPIADVDNDWPVTARADWQLAIHATP